MKIINITAVREMSKPTDIRIFHVIVCIEVVSNVRHSDRPRVLWEES